MKTLTLRLMLLALPCAMSSAQTSPGYGMDLMTQPLPGNAFLLQFTVVGDPLATVQICSTPDPLAQPWQPLFQMQLDAQGVASLAVPLPAPIDFPGHHLQALMFGPAGPQLLEESVVGIGATVSLLAPGGAKVRSGVLKFNAVTNTLRMTGRVCPTDTVKIWKIPPFGPRVCVATVPVNANGTIAWLAPATGSGLYEAKVNGKHLCYSKSD